MLYIDQNGCKDLLSFYFRYNVKCKKKCTFSTKILSCIFITATDFNTELFLEQQISILK